MFAHAKDRLQSKLAIAGDLTFVAPSKKEAAGTLNGVVLIFT